MTGAFHLVCSNRPESHAKKQTTKKKQAEEQQRSTVVAVVRNNTERLWTGAACWLQWCYLHQSRGTYWQRRAAKGVADTWQWHKCKWRNWPLRGCLSILSLFFLPVHLNHAKSTRCRRHAEGRMLQSRPLNLKRPQGKTRRCPPAQVASHWTLSLAQTQRVLETKGPMRRWGWLTSFAVITGPVKEWQPVWARSPSEKWRLWKRLIQTPIAFCPRRSSQLNHFSPTCSICSLTKMQNQQRTEK